MAPLAPDDMHRLTELINQSPPLDLSKPCLPAGVAGKTILITGGASGFRANFARHWATHGANIIVGDINDARGEELVAELREASGSPHHHFRHCDVTSWPSQVALFRDAAQLSPHGVIDAVVPNAGITDRQNAMSMEGFENPRDLDAENPPPPPPLLALNVNLTGVMYTTHLALFWLQRESGHRRDAHILFIGSIAGITALPGLPEYCASKHAVAGLFRTLRGTVWRQGVRVNLLCPYFVHTDILTPAAQVFLAGGGLGKVEDVVDAATRCMADGAVNGHALVVGPRMLVREGADGTVTDVDVQEGQGQAVWEVMTRDYESPELFVYRYLRMLNTVVLIRGWIGWLADMMRVLLYGGGKKAKK